MLSQRLSIFLFSYFSLSLVSTPHWLPLPIKANQLENETSPTTLREPEPPRAAMACRRASIPRFERVVLPSKSAASSADRKLCEQERCVGRHDRMSRDLIAESLRARGVASASTPLSPMPPPSKLRAIRLLFDIKAEASATAPVSEIPLPPKKRFCKSIFGATTLSASAIAPSSPTSFLYKPSVDNLQVGQEPIAFPSAAAPAAPIEFTPMPNVVRPERAPPSAKRLARLAAPSSPSELPYMLSTFNPLPERKASAKASVHLAVTPVVGKCSSWRAPLANDAVNAAQRDTQPLSPSFVPPRASFSHDGGILNSFSADPQYR